MNRADRDAADAKLDRVDELMEEIHELNAKVDRKMERVDELMDDVEELTDE